MREAILLVGGQGTRLRPLTISTPKPMLPVAGFPCTEHQIARAREAGITRIILGTSYRAEVFESYFGDGSEFGVELVYAVENEPLGTGGAIRHAAMHLHSGPDEPVVIFNGDVLTGVDLVGLVGEWTTAQADVALYLTRVEDPRAYGLVPTDGAGRVLEFREKPTTPEEIVTDQINAGCYVFKRSVIDRIPADRPVSVERETFPELLNSNAVVIGVVDDGYWLDLGTPLAFAQGSADLVLGNAPSPLIGNRAGQFIVDATATVGDGSQLSAGTHVGAGAHVSPTATVSASVVFPGAQIADGVHIQNSIIGIGAQIGAGSILTGVVVADGAVVGAGVELTQGARVFPDVHIPDGAIRFSSDKS